MTDIAGNPVMRSRWVPRDRDEALRYFAQTADYLGREVLAGGHDAIHGYDVNLDEAYPHMQLMADTLAESPSKPGELRVAAQQMWGVSREVVDANGKVEQPKAKMTRYQQRYREHMHGLGYEIELDASERSTSSHTREEWAALKERERVAEAFGDKVAEFSQRIMSDAEINKANAAKITAAREKLNADLAEIEEAEDDLDERSKEVAARESDWLTRKGRLDAREADLDRRDQETVGAHLAAQRARSDADAAMTAQRAEQARLRALREEVERDLAAAGAAPQPPSYADMRTEFLSEQSVQLTAYAKRVKRADGTTMYEAFEEHARREHARLQLRGRPVPSYEMWRDRTAAAQKKLIMQELSDTSSTPSPLDPRTRYPELGD